MASLNQLVSELAHTLSQPNNYALREQLRNAIIHTRNELIRHSMEQHGYVDAVLQQKYKVSLIKLTDGDPVPDELEIPDELKAVVLRTKDKVHRPVRLTNNLPFTRVGTPGYFNNSEIPYIKEASARFRRWLPGMRGQSCYDYINEYIYIFPNDVEYHSGLGTMSASLSEHWDSIIIQAAFENPTLVQKDIDDNNKYSFEYDDDEWFLPEDMIGQIKDIILKREFANINRENDETPNTIKMT